MFFKRGFKMSIGMLGKKVGMIRVFNAAGKALPVTVIEAGPCKVTQIKTAANDAYAAIQVGFDPMREDRLKKPIKGHLKKSGVSALRRLKEFRMADEKALAEYKLGQEIKVDIFKPGDYVDVSGVSKGRGFQGVVRRHGFAGMKASHGANEYFRRPGSIGTNTFGSNTKRGKKLPGRFGNANNTVLNLEVVKVDPEQNVLVVKGGIPGADGGFVVIRKTRRG